jgi:hypothetical protein
MKLDSRGKKKGKVVPKLCTTEKGGFRVDEEEGTNRRRKLTLRRRGGARRRREGCGRGRTEARRPGTPVAAAAAAGRSLLNGCGGVCGTEVVWGLGLFCSVLFDSLGRQGRICNFRLGLDWIIAISSLLKKYFL